MLDRTEIKNAIDAGGGMLRLEPSWVPRSFMIPGERLKLHPRDLYALGGHRGGINERWFSSTTNAEARSHSMSSSRRATSKRTSPRSIKRSASSR